MKLIVDHQQEAIAFPHQKRLVVPVGESQVERQSILTSSTGFPSIVVPAGFSPPTDSAKDLDLARLADLRQLAIAKTEITIGHEIQPYF